MTPAENPTRMEMEVCVQFLATCWRSRWIHVALFRHDEELLGRHLLVEQHITAAERDSIGAAAWHTWCLALPHTHSACPKGTFFERACLCPPCVSYFASNAHFYELAKNLTPTWTACLENRSRWFYMKFGLIFFVIVIVESCQFFKLQQCGTKCSLIS